MLRLLGGEPPTGTSGISVGADAARVGHSRDKLRLAMVAATVNQAASTRTCPGSAAGAPGSSAAASRLAIGLTGRTDPTALIHAGTAPIMKTSEKNATGSNIPSPTALIALLDGMAAARARPLAARVTVPYNEHRSDTRDQHRGDDAPGQVVHEDASAEGPHTDPDTTALHIAITPSACASHPIPRCREDRTVRAAHR
jgi:hypothetical protein